MITSHCVESRRTATNGDEQQRMATNGDDDAAQRARKQQRDSDSRATSHFSATTRR
jgi:hypothetical protein